MEPLVKQNVVLQCRVVDHTARGARLHFLLDLTYDSKRRIQLSEGFVIKGAVRGESRQRCGASSRESRCLVLELIAERSGGHVNGGPRETLRALPGEEGRCVHDGRGGVLGRRRTSAVAYAAANGLCSLFLYFDRNRTQRCRLSFCDLVLAFLCCWGRCGMTPAITNALVRGVWALLLSLHLLFSCRPYGTKVTPHTCPYCPPSLPQPVRSVTSTQPFRLDQPAAPRNRFPPSS
mmetsp:Transcript_42106/g.105294  ORF Transcript_42106/g.105294 Transcript_42106/m.105294 type:complete len:234 (+) Transcript_42106:102-803(+)